MYENYCKIRNFLKYKDSDVAKGANVPKSTFSDWKTGRSVPKLDKLNKIAEFLGVSIETLMSGNIEWDPSTQEIYKKKPSLFINHADGTKEPIYGIHEAAEQAYYLDEKTKEIAEFLHKNPEYSVLFDASKKVKPEDMQKALKAINLFIDEE